MNRVYNNVGGKAPLHPDKVAHIISLTGTSLKLREISELTGVPIATVYKYRNMKRSALVEKLKGVSLEWKSKLPTYLVKGFTNEIVQ